MDARLSFNDEELCPRNQDEFGQAPGGGRSVQLVLPARKAWVKMTERLVIVTMVLDSVRLVISLYGIYTCRFYIHMY